MDTEYIKMADCPEIQALRPTPDEYNSSDDAYVSLFYLPKLSKVIKENGIRILKWDNDESHPIIGEYGDDLEGAIWLPFQHQLQEMVFESRVVGFTKWNKPGLQSICTTIEQFSKSETGIGITINGTMEQLWLAFVMQHKYNKLWDGKKWVEE